MIFWSLFHVIYTHALIFFSLLVAGYIQKLIKESGVNLKVGLVQTAYANGSSTEYINNTLVTLNAILFISSLSLCEICYVQGVEVACVPTGVKFLHHRALEFDVGVYFEANGHGTVVFSPAATEAVKAAVADERYNIKLRNTILAGLIFTHFIIAKFARRMRCSGQATEPVNGRNQSNGW